MTHGGQSGKGGLLIRAEWQVGVVRWCGWDRECRGFPSKALSSRLSLHMDTVQAGRLCGQHQRQGLVGPLLTVKATVDPSPRPFLWPPW